MPIVFHPARGSVVTVSYEKGFKNPEMDKTRLAVVLSPAIRAVFDRIESQGDSPGA